MKWKWLIFSIVFAIHAVTLSAQTDTISMTRHEQKVESLHRRWSSIIPSIGGFQYGGNIGMVSIHLGWDYGKNERWETLFHFGFLPKYHADRAAATLTLKENFIPWSFGLGKRSWAQNRSATYTLSSTPLPWNRRSRFSIEPIVCSTFVNTILNDEFWVREPEKYNSGDYYRFSSKVRLHFGIGSRLSINVPREYRRSFDRISFYYELSTFDLAIISAVPNKKISASDILCLGAGVQYKFF